MIDSARGWKKGYTYGMWRATNTGGTVERGKVENRGRDSSGNYTQSDSVSASTQRGASRYCAEEPSDFTIWRRHISHYMRQSVLLGQHSYIYMFIKILFKNCRVIDTVR